jgi:hypothetical protein
LVRTLQGIYSEQRSETARAAGQQARTARKGSRSGEGMRQERNLRKELYERAKQDHQRRKSKCFQIAS